MTQCDTLNIKLSNSQLKKLKSAIKNGTEVTLNLSSNLIKSSNYETHFPHKLVLTNTQASKIGKAFANGASGNIKFSKTQLPKIVQLGGLLFSTDITGNPLMLPANSFFSLMDSIEKEPKNVGLKIKK